MPRMYYVEMATCAVQQTARLKS